MRSRMPGLRNGIIVLASALLLATFLSAEQGHAAGVRNWCNGILTPREDYFLDPKAAVTISGRIMKVTGPAGKRMGQDRRYRDSWNLKLDGPITAIFNQQTGEKLTLRLLRLSVRSDAESDRLALLNGKHVEVTGNLFAPSEVGPLQDQFVLFALVAVDKSPAIVCTAK